LASDTDSPPPFWKYRETLPTTEGICKQLELSTTGSPPDGFQYSNFGFAVAGLIIESASGKSERRNR
jgi:CubicO group peptidase (beta-lactamase class C family)